MSRILVIEDDLDTRDLMARFLSQAGHQLSLAANGWEGLLALERPVDLVLLDMMMPGMAGEMFLKTMRGQRTTRDVPVVIVTALDPVEVRPRVEPLGVSDIVSKGNNFFHQLTQTLDRHLEPPRPHARVQLPEPGSLIRPYLDVYLKMLAWQ